MKPAYSFSPNHEYNFTPTTTARFYTTVFLQKLMKIAEAVLPIIETHYRASLRSTLCFR